MTAGASRRRPIDDGAGICTGPIFVPGPNPPGPSRALLSVTGRNAERLPDIERLTLTTIEHTKYAVSLYDGPDANGIAGLIGTHLGESLEADPSRIELARTIVRPVAIVSVNSDSACTIVCGDDEAVVYNGLVGQPEVVLIVTDEHLDLIAQLPGKVGPLGALGLVTGRGVRLLAAILTRRLVVKGLLAHPATVLHTIALLSASPT